MLVLVVDTSSEAVTAAVVEVVDDATVEARAEVVTVNARGHGELLAPSIRQALAQARAVPRDLGALVAGTGPGPYTGLRVGLVTAAVMADALGVPTYGVCSLDGYCAPDERGSLLVATDARRREVYWARYSDGRRIAGPAVDRPADVAHDADEIAGAAATMYDFDAAAPRVLHPVPAYLAQRAAERIKARAPGEPLTPLYLRRPDATVPGAPKAVTP